MPRRRLYGETQKRRKKKQTKLLKRQGSVHRVQSTQERAAFERSPELQTEDIVFLESMRELKVQRFPWHGEAPARQQAAEKITVQGESNNSAMFYKLMQHMGVRPLEPQARAVPMDVRNGSSPSLSAEPHLHAEQNTPPQEAPAADPKPGGLAVPASLAPGWSRETPEARQPGEAPKARALREKHTKPAEPPALQDAVPLLNAASPATPMPPPPKASSGQSRTVFSESSQDLADMAALLRGDALDTSQKFEGAPPQPVRPAPMAKAPQHPDDELDLHGKTQEQAIRLVQGFLLRSHKLGLRAVLIITGRGLNSGPGGGVLKDAVTHWLERNGKPYVREFDSAPPAYGGQGALLVALKAPKRPTPSQHQPAPPHGKS